MGQNIGAVDFLLGIIAGTLISFAFTCVCSSRDQNVNCNCNGVRSDRLKDAVEVNKDQLNKFNCLSSPVCDTVDGDKYRWRDYEADSELGTNTQVISKQELEANEEFIRQNEEFDKEILSKLKDRGDMEMALRRSSAVTSLAHALTMAKDEKACFQVVSELIVPLFQTSLASLG